MQETETLDELHEVNQQLEAVARIIKPLHYLTPINGKEQKNLFLRKEVDEPDFVYRPIEFSLEEVLRDLEGISIPDMPQQERIEMRKNRLKQKLILLANRGNREAVLPLSIQLYGMPEADILAKAEHLLAIIPAVSEEKTVPADELKQALLETFAMLGLDQWNVEYSDKWITTVYHFEKKITLNGERLFSKKDVARLPVHEIMVHVMRHENHHLQDRDLMETLFTGEYLATEEGLASYAEEVTNTTSPENMRDYAGRVIAVQCVLDGKSFRESFDALLGYGFTDEQAWQLCQRTHRAGGFTRDIAYLAGHEKIKTFAAQGGDITLLYVGKIDLSELELAKECLADGRLKEPHFVPEFFAQQKQ